MAEVKTWFAEAIYTDKIFNKAQNKEVADKIKTLDSNYFKPTNEWNCSVINTFKTYQPHEDVKFANLVHTIEEHTNNFARALGSEHNYKCTESWVNIAKKGHYQEYHIHPNASFSAVYYVDRPKNSGNIVFRKMPYETYELKGKIAENKLTYQTAVYGPELGQLLIFRSYMPHMVTENRSDKNRVSIAFNLD